MVNEDKLKGLSANQLRELALTMNDFMERTWCEITIATGYSQRAEERMLTAYDAINRISSTVLGSVPFKHIMSL